MKKTVWLTLVIALVLVNAVSWVGYQITGIYVPMILRLMMVLGLTIMASVFTAAFLLVNKLEEEVPLTAKRRPRPTPATGSPADAKPAMPEDGTPP